MSALDRPTPRIRTHWVVLGTLGAVLALLLVVPLVALLLSVSPAELGEGLRHPLVWPALRLSLLTTTISLAIIIVFGTPLAWVLARSRARWMRPVEATLQLPVVLPPAVAGVALLMAFGRHGALSFLYPEGESVAFTTAAVVLAEVFVAAPFFLQSAVSAFRRIDARHIIVARTMGASPMVVFVRVGLPLALPGLVAGGALAWARALGEFGATLMFAGNLEGVTQTLPLAIYTALEADLRAAQALSIVLVVVAFGLLVFIRAVTKHADRPEESR